MEVRAEHSKKAGSTPSDAPTETLMICTETLMICTYCREKYFPENKNKDLEMFVPSTTEFNQNLFIHGTIS